LKYKPPAGVLRLRDGPFQLTIGPASRADLHRRSQRRSRRVRYGCCGGPDAGPLLEGWAERGRDGWRFQPDPGEAQPRVLAAPHGVDRLGDLEVHLLTVESSDGLPGQVVARFRREAEDADVGEVDARKFLRLVR
jgi:hypothetical protein